MDGLYHVEQSVQIKVTVENVSEVNAIVYRFECYNNNQPEDSEVPENEIVLEPGESSSFFTEFVTQNNAKYDTTKALADNVIAY